MRNWKNWIKAAGIRAIKTVAQTAVATIGTTAVMAEVNWVAVGSAKRVMEEVRRLPIRKGEPA